MLNKPSMALPVEYQMPFKPVFLNICVVKELLSLNIFFRLHAQKFFENYVLGTGTF